MPPMQLGAYEYDTDAPFRPEFSEYARRVAYLRSLPALTPAQANELHSFPPYAYIGCTFHGQPVGISRGRFRDEIAVHVKNPRYGMPWTPLFDSRRQAGPPPGWEHLTAGVDYPVERPAGGLGRLLYQEPWDVDQTRIWFDGPYPMGIAPNVIDPVTGAVLGPVARPQGTGYASTDEVAADLAALIAKLTGRRR